MKILFLIFVLFNSLNYISTGGDRFIDLINFFEDFLIVFNEFKSDFTIISVQLQTTTTRIERLAGNLPDDDPAKSALLNLVNELKIFTTNYGSDVFCPDERSKRDLTQADLNQLSTTIANFLSAANTLTPIITDVAKLNDAIASLPSLTPDLNALTSLANSASNNLTDITVTWLAKNSLRLKVLLAAPNQELLDVFFTAMANPANNAINAANFLRTQLASVRSNLLNACFGFDGAACALNSQLQFNDVSKVFVIDTTASRNLVTQFDSVNLSACNLAKSMRAIYDTVVAEYQNDVKKVVDLNNVLKQYNHPLTTSLINWISNTGVPGMQRLPVILMEVGNGLLNIFDLYSGCL